MFQSSDKSYEPVMKKNVPTILVCHIDTRADSQKDRRVLAERCCGEVRSLCGKITASCRYLKMATKRKDTFDCMQLAEYHYENALMRMYSLRERIWDTIAAINEMPRPNTGNGEFRKSARSKLANNHPDVMKAFQAFYQRIEMDMKNRNTATHETDLHFALDFGGEFREVREVITWADPAGPEGKHIESTVREALVHFVATEVSRWKKTVDAALKLERALQGVIKTKLWQPRQVAKPPKGRGKK